VKNDEWAKMGFAPSAYFVSKAMLNTYSRFILRKMAKPTQQIYVCSPGWCRTDMGTKNALKSAKEGPDTLIYLIELPFKYDNKLDSKYFEEREIDHF